MGLFDLLFPKKCAGCGRVGTYFCVSCIREAKLCEFQICPICERNALDGLRHEWCRRKSYTPDGLISLWAYQETPRRLILKLKYKYVSEAALSLAAPAAGVLKDFKRSTPHAPAWNSKLTLVPIPLHWTRKNWRGFNHVEEVGKLLAKLMGWEMANLLVRTKMAKQQVGLKGKERRENIQGVFSINPSNSITQVLSNQIVLFDDVWTTGATMKEAARVLKKAGFRKVWCLTLAK